MWQCPKYRVHGTTCKGTETADGYHREVAFCHPGKVRASGEIPDDLWKANIMSICQRSREGPGSSRLSSLGEGRGACPPGRFGLLSQERCWLTTVTLWGERGRSTGCEERLREFYFLWREGYEVFDCFLKLLEWKSIEKMGPDSSQR